jgi:putative endonuclease
MKDDTNCPISSTSSLTTLRRCSTQGVTNDLIRRTQEHRDKLADGFTKRYNISRLVYYEVCEGIQDAIEREKAIKGGSRARKMALIDGFNPTWRDLFDEL